MSAVPWPPVAERSSGSLGGLGTRWVLLAASCVVACSEAQEPPLAPDGQDDTATAVQSDTTTPDAADGAASDAADVAGPTDPPPLPTPLPIVWAGNAASPHGFPPETPCPAPEAVQPFRTGPGQYAANIFHFNIQYVAGGLDNFLGVWTVGEEEIEDLIITESFEPLLTLYEKHPTWGVSFEMQGLMLEIMAARHPKVLDRLRTMARRGQADVMSYHWSDQLVTAYPRRHMEWSWAENQEIFETLCIPRPKVHFLQEGQFGPGIQDFAAQYGELVVLPRNLMKFFHQPPPPGVWYTNLGIKTLTTDGASGDGFQLAWTFVDDGELLATGGAAPYLVDAFIKNDKAIAEYEQSLADLEASGFAHVPLSHYVAQLEASNVPTTPIEPPILDGSWQPGSSNLMTIWMGGIGAEPGNERDNQLLTGNVVLGQRLRALEALYAAEFSGPRARGAQPGRGACGADRPEGQPSSVVDEAAVDRLLRHARRELLLAEVSDGTGWRPAGTEVKYALRHAAEARRLIDDVARHLLWQLCHRGAVAVDPNTGVVSPASRTERGADVAPALTGLEITSERAHSVSWTAHEAPDVTLLEVTFPAGANVTQGTSVPPAIAIRFPFAGTEIAYCPSNQETKLLSVPFDGYEVTRNEAELGLPLPNGLIALDADRTLVLDLSTIHLAARIGTSEDDTPRLEFKDEVYPAHEALTWRFYVVARPAAEVVSFANAVNVTPAVVFEVGE